MNRRATQKGKPALTAAERYWKRVKTRLEGLITAAYTAGFKAGRKAEQAAMERFEAECLEDQKEQQRR